MADPPASPVSELVLVAAADQALVGALGERLPSVTVQDLAGSLPLPCGNDLLWCFIDWILPDTSGLELCRQVRRHVRMSQASITLAIDPGAADARRRAIQAGADDYMIGPLRLEPLIARLESYRSRPAQPYAPHALRNGELVLDLAAHRARYRGRQVTLRPTEWQLLRHFIENADQVLSRSALIGLLGKDAAISDERTVDVWVGRLRRALTRAGMHDPLRTVRAAGYVFDSPDR